MSSTCDLHPYIVTLLHGDNGYWGPMPVVTYVSSILKYNSHPQVRGTCREISRDWIELKPIPVEEEAYAHPLRGLFRLLARQGETLGTTALMYLGATFGREMTRQFRSMGSGNAILKWITESPWEVLDALKVPPLFVRTPEASAAALLELAALNPREATSCSSDSARRDNTATPATGTT